MTVRRYLTACSFRRVNKLFQGFYYIAVVIKVLISFLFVESSKKKNFGKFEKKEGKGSNRKQHHKTIPCGTIGCEDLEDKRKQVKLHLLNSGKSTKEGKATDDLSAAFCRDKKEFSAFTQCNKEGAKDKQALKKTAIN